MKWEIKDVRLKGTWWGWVGYKGEGALISASDMKRAGVCHLKTKEYIRTWSILSPRILK